ncbi:MAG TPA: DegT/DnrJ/EryC1/StrS family aminotransferase [Candidatus Hydrogenedentes bacterium]|nr:DegT/DnrJ/EryC1/StrS family aminotransferase [Candidatus Hydrogenedentota bacterium]
MQVPFLDLKTPHNELANEILPLWEDILRNAAFVGGPHVAGFEEEFAQACGTAHCVAVNSGTDALRFIFIALGMQPGDEVITVANTFIATTEAITQAGGRPVFVDIDPDTCNMDPQKIEAAITPRTKGIVPVHLYGQTADMDPILAIARRKGLWVVEDAAQAQLAEYKGRRAGSMGVMAATSFYPGKNLGACGEAGAVMTNDAALAAMVRKIRDHGQAKKYYHDVEGYNGRCDALQAAALRVKLRRLPEWNAARRAVAARYLERLSGMPGVVAPKVADGCLPVWHLFVIQAEKRDAVADALRERGVGTGLHYPVPLHLQEAYRHLGVPEGALPVTEACSRRLLSLPMFPGLTEAQIDYVCESLAAVMGK